MAFDDKTRNRLRGFVTDARKILSEEFTRQLQNLYGLDPKSGEVTDLERLTHLDLTSLEIAKVLRATLEHYRATSPEAETAAILDRIVREQAFTILNRLCALRLAEARDVLIESVARGYQSQGFQLYARVSNGALGDTGAAYRSYLLNIFDELAMDLPVLFYRYSPQGRLFPTEQTLLDLLDLINHDDLKDLWSEDETVGWIYQYFNSVEERKKMRDESSAPRNSREMAVRNQFFTPRYVVEFLTDNTLGRIWYEMRKGQTELIDYCQYFVRRPNEIFLEEGQDAPVEMEVESELSQEELWKQPVQIPFREQKDPRDLKILDPAMGSGHFLLYAFDLLEIIYREAWEIDLKTPSEGTGRTLREDYPTKDAINHMLPELIFRYNLHGVDIDPRAVQIAGLALWLRAQKAWKLAGVKVGDRPKIRKSNLVVAEPMPGEQDMLEEFLKDLKPTLLGRLVRLVFESMKLAGEAGILLRIEHELQQAINNARGEWKALQQTSDVHVTGLQPDIFGEASAQQKGIVPRQAELMEVSSERFWQEVEDRVLELLRRYADKADGGDGISRRLFAEDAAKGFAFLDLCQNKYDVVLMNPPFGSASTHGLGDIGISPDVVTNNILCAFILVSASLTTYNGLIGALTDRTWLQKVTYEGFRKHVLLSVPRLELLFDLGTEVLDGAQVEACAQVFRNSSGIFTATFCDLRRHPPEVREDFAKKDIVNPLMRSLRSFCSFPDSAIAYWCPDNITELFLRYNSLDPHVGYSKRGISAGDTTRAFRCEWEVPVNLRGTRNKWEPLQNGGDFSPYFRGTAFVCLSESEFAELKPLPGARIQNIASLRQIGITWGKRCGIPSYSILPKGHIFTDEGQAVLPKDIHDIWVLLGVLNSATYRFVLNLFCGQHKSNGYVGKLPIDGVLANQVHQNISTTVQEIYFTLYEQDVMEPGWNFSSTLAIIGKLTSQTLQSKLGEIFLDRVHDNLKISKLQDQIDEAVADLCKLSVDDRDVINSNNGSVKNPCVFSIWNLSVCQPEFNVQLVSQLLSEAIGIAFGRWDVLVSTGAKEVPQLSKPFELLPVLSPGMLASSDGSPLRGQEDVRSDYPIEIPWDGILVNDSAHTLDIYFRLKQVFDVVWGIRADGLLHEMEEILGQTECGLRCWLEREFFPFHLNRYSKSRRKAPIYWPLAVPSGEYTLWIYYHRLTNQTLLTVVNEFVEPKISQINQQVNTLRQRTGRTKTQEEELAAMVDLEAELKDFREELLRIAKFWKPNLNDGVQITAAPLWRFFQHKPWQKILKQTWDELEKGKYDWAHLAYSIWPDRVREKCIKDKSLAIAHGLEDLYVEPPAGKKKTRKKKLVESIEVDD